MYIAPTRRDFFTHAAVATGAAFVADQPESASAGVAEVLPVEPRDTALGVNVRLFAPSDPKGDWTEAFQRAIDLAGAAYKRVIVPNGTYRVRSIVIPKRVRLSGVAADGTAHDPSPIDNGGANLIRIADGNDEPMVTVSGHGVTIENLVFNGSGVAADVIRFEDGFDSRMSSVRVTNSARSGIVGVKLNNTHWSDVFVSRCGSDSAGAVVIKSPVNADPSRTRTNSNAVTLLNCTIEASRNVALDVGWGPGTDSFVEFVRFIALHVETAGAGTSDDATIRIGNVRSVDFVAPFIYGAPGRPLIRYARQRAQWANLFDGVRIVGGTLLGANASGIVDGSVQPLRPTPTLLHLVSGDDVALTGTRLGQFTEAAVTIEPAFGPRVSVDRSNFAIGVTEDRQQTRDVPLVVDKRSEGISARAGSANAAGAVRIAGDLDAGTIYFDVGTTSSPGSQVDVKFGITYAEPPVVVISPLTPQAARSRYFTSTSTRGFILHFAEGAPLVGTSGEQYRFGYRVDRRRHAQGNTFLSPSVPSTGSL